MAAAQLSSVISFCLNKSIFKSLDMQMNPAYLVTVSSQDKLAGLLQEWHLA